MSDTDPSTIKPGSSTKLRFLLMAFVLSLWAALGVLFVFDSRFPSPRYLGAHLWNIAVLTTMFTLAALCVRRIAKDVAKRLRADDAPATDAAAVAKDSA
ncbi:hypothetical protein [Marinivivus vitaminiproducens]|uniref:hypothetical protein n=1 Tax=Marinivivus vitaminiproducens TaxID=3035935 RepID=UPI0027A1B64D|nr:hypothetical protein P4R82_16420 [Geminicoccaceae bacterium SCSIO 64248]